MWLPGLSDHYDPTVQWSVAICVSAIGLVTDLKSRRIPNLLTLPVFIGGVAWATVAGGFSGMAEALGASAILALPFIVLFLFAGGGAGDAKLMGALGAWLGLIPGLATLGCVAASGVALGIAVAIARGEARQTMGNVRAISAGYAAAALTRAGVVAQERPEVEKMATVPYGVAIFVGTCLAAGGTLLWHG